MSGFVGSTPVLQIAVRNPFLKLGFPSEGTVVGVVDTGYDGFLAVPGEIFSVLGLDKVSPSTRVVVTGDGRPLELLSSPASVEVPELPRTFDGYVETAAGLEEVLVGTRLLRELRLTLDYRGGMASFQACR
jgi:clan AA aspartic protease